jgi:hypothetical protein
MKTHQLLLYRVSVVLCHRHPRLVFQNPAWKRIVVMSLLEKKQLHPAHEHQTNKRFRTKEPNSANSKTLDLQSPSPHLSERKQSNKSRKQPPKRDRKLMKRNDVTSRKTRSVRVRNGRHTDTRLEASLKQQSGRISPESRDDHSKPLDLPSPSHGSKRKNVSEKRRYHSSSSPRMKTSNRRSLPRDDLVVEPKCASLLSSTTLLLPSIHEPKRHVDRSMDELPPSLSRNSEKKLAKVRRRRKDRNPLKGELVRVDSSTESLQVNPKLEKRFAVKKDHDKHNDFTDEKVHSMVHSASPSQNHRKKERAITTTGSSAKHRQKKKTALVVPKGCASEQQRADRLVVTARSRENSRVHLPVKSSKRANKTSSPEQRKIHKCKTVKVDQQYSVIHSNLSVVETPSFEGNTVLPLVTLSRSKALTKRETYNVKRSTDSHEDRDAGSRLLSVSSVSLNPWKMMKCLKLGIHMKKSDSELTSRNSFLGTSSSSIKKRRCSLASSVIISSTFAEDKAAISTSLSSCTDNSLSHSKSTEWYICPVKIDMIDDCKSRTMEMVFFE